MAIFNSIALGKTKGSIGNITTTTLKGQSVAKQRNFNPANPRTVDQVNSRGKMSNAVKAWQFAAIFFSLIDALRKPLESNYNAFVRLTKTAFTDTVQSSGALALSFLEGALTFVGNFISVTTVLPAEASVTVSFNTNGLAYDASAHVRILSWDQLTSKNIIVDRVISAPEWAAGSAVVLADMVTVSHGSAYIYTADKAKCSNFIIAAV